jgi:hypothetical protein
MYPNEHIGALLGHQNDFSAFLSAPLRKALPGDAAAP